MLVLDYPRVKKVLSWGNLYSYNNKNVFKHGCLFALEHVAEIQPLVIKKSLKQDSVKQTNTLGWPNIKAKHTLLSQINLFPLKSRRAVLKREVSCSNKGKLEKFSLYRKEKEFENSFQSPSAFITPDGPHRARQAKGSWPSRPFLETQSRRKGEARSARTRRTYGRCFPGSLASLAALPPAPWEGLSGDSSSTEWSKDPPRLSAATGESKAHRCVSEVAAFDGAAWLLPGSKSARRLAAKYFQGARRSRWS